MANQVTIILPPLHARVGYERCMCRSSSMQGDSNWCLLLTAMLLGFRHGVDWDHIAAIVDITGGDFVGAVKRPLKLEFFRLPLFYAVGHCLIVFALALTARALARHLPEWLDPVAERLVGCTLIVFGVWILWGVVLDLRKRRFVRLTSKWGLLLAAVSKLAAWLAGGRASLEATTPTRCSPPAAFGLGMLHGIGAETGTQVILLSTVASAGNNASVAFLLPAFAFGLIVSNCLLATAIGAGFLTASGTQITSAMLGILASIFSIIIGSCFLSGTNEKLPPLSFQGQPPALVWGRGCRL